MAEYTENLNLILPKQTEGYNVEVANTNNQIIDNEIGNKVDKVPGKGLSSNDFTNGYKQKIDSMQRLYKFKGSIPTYDDLSTIEQTTVGDVYNTLDTNNNYCWDGIQWVELGIHIDLSEYERQLEELESTQNEKINNMQKNIENVQKDFTQQRYYLILNEDLEDNSELTIPCYYEVGNNSLKVYFEGELLEKDVHYKEVGQEGSISNKIKIEDWGDVIDAGFSFSFEVVGTYESEVLEE